MKEKTEEKRSPLDFMLTPDGKGMKPEVREAMRARLFSRNPFDRSMCTDTNCSRPSFLQLVELADDGKAETPQKLCEQCRKAFKLLQEADKR